jgi:hypothetical protein
MSFTVADLTRPEGLQHLIAVTGGTRSVYNRPDQALGIAEVAHTAIQKNPNLAHLKVKILPNLHNTLYNYDKRELLLGLANPAALAHELEHANNIQQDSLYANVLRAAQGVSRINNVMAVPTVMALRTFLQDAQRRDDVLKTLSAISAAVAAPVLVEEAAASAQAMRDSPLKGEAIKTLGPAFMAHLASSMSPTLIYQAGRMK